MNYSLLATNDTSDGMDYTVQLADGIVFTLHSSGGAPHDVDGWITAELQRLAALGIIAADDAPAGE